MLHKTSKLHGFHIVTVDGEIGHVVDFLIDETGNTHDLVVATHNWIGGKSVLIPPTAIVKIDSPHKQIRIRLTRDEVEHSPLVETADIELIETLPPPLI